MRKGRDRAFYFRAAIIVSMASVAAFELMSGVGTTCVAFWPEKWGEAFANYVPYAGIYQAITIITLIVGLAASVVTYAFIRREKWSFWAAIVVLAVGIASGAVHMYYSDMLRGSTAPASMRVYLDVLVLLFLLIVRFMPIWKEINSPAANQNEASYNIPTGISFAASGLGIMATPLYTGSSHTYSGVNYVEFLLPDLYIIGGILVAIGISFFVLAKVDLHINSGLSLIWRKTVSK